MTKIYLSGYSLRVKNRKRNLVLDKDEDEETKSKTPDNFLVLKNYLNIIFSEFDVNKDIRKLIKVEKLKVDNSDKERILSGLIKTGEYGYESELVKVPNRLVSHKRETDEAEMLPFYFLISMPSGRDEGIVILQRFGQKGIRKIFLDSFNKYYKNLYPNFKIEMWPLVTKKLIDYYMNYGGLKKIRFIKFSMSKDIEDAYDSQDHEEEEGYTELIAHADRGLGKFLHLKGRVKEFLNGKRELKKLIELKEHSFEYDNVKLELEVDKTSRTIDLSHIYKLRAYYDITDRVRMSENGHPEFESIDRNARELLKDLSDAIGWTINEQ